MSRDNQYIVPYRIYYKDTDCGLVVYYGRYMEMMEVARTEYMRKLNCSPSQIEKEENLIFPVSEMSVKYKKSAVYDDLIEMHISLEVISPIRFIFYYDFYNEKQEHLFTGSTQMTSISKKTHQLKKIPPSIIKKMVAN